MKRLIQMAAGLLFLLPAILQAQVLPEVDTAEVDRRGDMVVRTGEIRAGCEQAISDAFAPPTDDSGKWFVTIVVADSCKPCEQLKSDLVTNKNLRAFANPKDPKASWSHLNIYRAEDKTQAFRFKDIKIGGYPTLIIQPPRNRQFGDPAAVVLQVTGYDGDGDKLARTIRDGISAYLKKTFDKQAYAPRPGGYTKREIPPPGGWKSNEPSEGGYEQAPFQPGGQETWPQLPQLEPSGVTVEQLRAVIPDATPDFLLEAVTSRFTLDRARARWQELKSLRELQALKDQLTKQAEDLKKAQESQATPAAQPAPVAPATPAAPGLGLLTLILTAISSPTLGNITLLAIAGLAAIRTYRKQAGKQLLVSDGVFSKVMDFLGGGQSPTTPAAPK